VRHWQFGPNGGVHRMFRLSDGLWFRGEDRSVRYDPAGDSWSYFATPFNAVINDPALVLRLKVLNLGWRETILAAAGDSALLWLGTDQGIYTYRAGDDVLTRQFKFSTAGGSPAPGTRTVNDILLDRDSVFIATDNGIISYDRSGGGWSLFSDSLNQSYFGAFGIGVTSRRRYYAVYGGLETRDSSGEPELLIPPGFNVGAYPHALAGVGDKLFVATGNGILVYSEPLRTWQTLTTESGLPDSRITSLYADDQWLWILTPAGISRFNYHRLFP
jgi:ligand-binding sensor domain-containing protein